MTLHGKTYINAYPLTDENEQIVNVNCVCVRVSDTSASAPAKSSLDAMILNVYCNNLSFI